MVQLELDPFFLDGTDAMAYDARLLLPITAMASPLDTLSSLAFLGVRMTALSVAAFWMAYVCKS
jgi:hypothetical protein